MGFILEITAYYSIFVPSRDVYLAEDYWKRFFWPLLALGTPEAGQHKQLLGTAHLFDISWIEDSPLPGSG